MVDGDTLHIGADKIRLHGLDAPEQRQSCTRGKLQWPCGTEASDHLRTLIDGQDVRCDVRDVDRFGRYVAICHAGGVNLNALMVADGYAVAYRRYSKDYVAAEQQAKSASRGMWAGTFDWPWDWRAKRR